MSIMACQPPNADDAGDHQKGLLYDLQKSTPPSTRDNAKIHIGNNTVTLAKAHVVATRPERYQPSFRLEGVIAPKSQNTILLPVAATLQTLHVQTGDSVKKGDTIATFYQTVSIPTTNHGNHQDSSPSTQSQENIDLSPSNTSSSLANEPMTTQTITRPFAIITPTLGKIEKIFIRNENIEYAQDTMIASVIDDSQLRFVSLLPKSFAEYVGIGDAVNFNSTKGTAFSGQIAKITPNTQSPDIIDIHVHIKADEAKKAKLELGDLVSGYVEYGQIQVGVLVPAFAVFDDGLNPINFASLKKAPYKPITPLKAFVWVIGQDERLSLSPIEVIEYRPKSDQYLIYGIALDGLLVLANLPKEAQGKSVRLK